MEPRAATPGRRLDAIRALADAGVPVGVMAAPVIPALTDHEMEPILEAAAGAGAREAGYVLLRMPYEIKDLFREWLEENAPGRAKHVLSLMRQMHGGRDYSAEWRVRQRGTGPYADLIEQRFRIACGRFGLNKRSTALDASQFRRPPRPGDQLSLF
jgi:DNA repair photolyase